ncbi:septation protein SepH [Xylanimonas protaetiae]|nr:septation protein SepH [Xylanimonas protaetiae]
MAELELVRLAQDGGSLVLRDADGTEHALPVTDALRAAVARATHPADPAPAATPGPATTLAAGPTLRPRDLQARLRAGATAEELAAESGIPLENVRRYEWPVLTEREHVIGMVRAHDVPGLDGTSELGAIADSRLAARGVQPDHATWTARREGTAPWVVEVRFSAGDRERSARWTFDLRGRLVTPLDDEARWLGQPDDPLTPEVRGVPSLAARRALPAADDETDLLLDDLAGRRGQRPAGRPHRAPTSAIPVVSPRTPPAAGSDDGDDSFQVIPLGDVPVRERTPVRTPEPVAEERTAGASVVDLGRWNPRRPRDKSVSPGAGPGATQPALLTPSGAPSRDAEPAEPAGDDARSAASPAAVGAAPRPGTPARGVPAARRKGRAAVPSWDEIVFGARPEPS